MMDANAENCDVVILGAGAAGIGAARRLLEDETTTNDLKVIVLEARNRPGGRAWTSDELQSGIELDQGAKWIHGGTSTNPTNPMMELAALYGVSTSTSGNGKPLETRVVVEGQSLKPDKKHRRAAHQLYKQLCVTEGPQSSIGQVAQDMPIGATYKDCLLELSKREMPGRTFEDWLESRAEQTLENFGQDEAKKEEHDVQQVLALLRLKIYSFFENYEGARLDQVSLHHGLSGTILGGGNADVKGGYGNLVQTIATSPITTNCSKKTIDIRYNICATSVDQTSTLDGMIAVTGKTSEGQIQQYNARMGCICAVPLGVLQDGKIDFNPPLPERLNLSLSRLAMCLMNKISILFPERWWPKGTKTLNLVSWKLNPTAAAANQQDDFSLGNIPWAHWIIEEDDPAILVCYATGIFAEQVESKTSEEVQNEAMTALRDAYAHDQNNGLDIGSIPDPIDVHVTRWRSDPMARGSWTFFPAGTVGLEDVSAFQQFNAEKNDDRKLYFAGEHTCDGSVDGLDIGTVHGALLSGRKAADDLLLSGI